MFLCGIGDEAVAMTMVVNYDGCDDEVFPCAVGEEAAVMTMVAMTRCFCVL